MIYFDVFAFHFPTTSALPIKYGKQNANKYQRHFLI